MLEYNLSKIFLSGNMSNKNKLKVNLLKKFGAGELQELCKATKRLY